MQDNNMMEVSFLSLSSNQAFARATVAAFVSQLDPTVEELADIKTAVSEAVTNAMIHGYENRKGTVKMTCSYHQQDVQIIVQDQGLGIANIEEAREPLYTSKPELERSGMGFTVMESFMDHVEIKSEIGKGTTITMSKKINKQP
ncbi:MAG TPA: anti-sigma F factor [Epulopiscium sp.]|nr:anti-sigma F factor [Candidatus Epulonipiscium sp.]